MDMVVNTSHLPLPGETILGGNFFMAAIDGYNIYRDGVLIKKLQLLNGNYPFSFTDKEGSLSSIYEISAYNVLGRESPKYKIEPIK